MNLQIKNLTFGFKNRELFKNFTFEIKTAQITLIQGPSGCGKSTFLKIIAGLLIPQSGEMNSAVTAQKKGYLHQDLHLIEHWSIKENLNLVDQDVKNQKTWLKNFELLMDSDSLVSNLSGGEKQRISLIRILLSKPELILLDEPTAHLDDYHTDIVLKSIRQEFINKTVVIVSHDQRVRKYSDQILNWEKDMHHGL